LISETEQPSGVETKAAEELAPPASALQYLEIWPDARKVRISVQVFITTMNNLLFGCSVSFVEVW